MIFNLSGVGTNLNWKDMVGNGFYLDPHASESVCTLKFVKVEDFVLIDGTVDFKNGSTTDFLHFSDADLKPLSAQRIFIWNKTTYLVISSSGIILSQQYSGTFVIHGCYYLK